MNQEPLFWYRPRSDGGYEGPLHNGQIEDVRKASGAWVPLFAGAAPVSAEPTDDEIIDIAVEPLGIDCDRMPYGIVVFARALLSRYSSAPATTQPDVTQQTLDDVMAGIPARDAEIAALRKEIDTLRAQQDADTVDAVRYRAWRDALVTGKTAEDDFIRLVADNLPTSVGVSRRPTAAEWDAAIDAARKEQA